MAAEFEVQPTARGDVKQALIKVGFPAEDLAGNSEGEALPLSFRATTGTGPGFALRRYQQEAASAFRGRPLVPLNRRDFRSSARQEWSRRIPLGRSRLTVGGTRTSRSS